MDRPDPLAPVAQDRDRIAAGQREMAECSSRATSVSARKRSISGSSST
jgi:hypothetical protein